MATKEQLLTEVIKDKKEHGEREFKTKASDLISKIAAKQKQIKDLEIQLAECRKELSELTYEEFKVDL